MALEHLNDSNFESAIANGVTIVDFWAQWCPPCMAFGPIFNAVAEKIPDVKFAKFEVVPTERETPGKYGIRSIPSIMAFKDGELIEAKVGLMQPSEFEEWVIGIK